MGNIKAPEIDAIAWALANASVTWGITLENQVLLKAYGQAPRNANLVTPVSVNA